MRLLIIPETYFFTNIIPMLANDPSSSTLERVYEQSAQENLERTAHLLLFVNMDPSKLSTMYTCILLAAEQCKKCGWYCITISLDLPLAKTTEMFLTEGKLTLISGVNVRLGRFHYMLLSWVRSVTENGTDACSMYARPFIL